MIISNNQAILVEGKLESPEGKYDSTGHGQKETQELIGSLLKQLVPAFSQTEFHDLMLAPKYPNKERWPLSVTWQEIAVIVKESAHNNH